MKWVFVISLVLMGIFLSAYASASVLDNIQKYADEYNKHLDLVPKQIKDIFGNERVNFEVTLNNGSTTVVGIVMKDARIEKVEEGGIKNPTMIAKTDEDVIEEIANSRNPAGTFLNAIKDGKIKIEGVGFFNWIKIAFTNFIIWLSGLFGLK